MTREPPLGRYFSIREFLATSRPWLQSDPTCEQQVAMAQLVAAVLDPLRAALGRPIRVTSGFRSPALNEAIGGSRTSDHMDGCAADIKVDGLDSSDLAALVLRLRLPFDQLIWYAPSRGGHVHVSYRPDRLRGQVLHAPEPGGYVAATPGG